MTKAGAASADALGFGHLSREQLLAIEKGLKEISKRKKFSRLDFYEPYPKQQQFHDLGLTKRERLLSAGNQNGKTWCGGAEAAYHLTGLYPDWWLGRRWPRPTIGWVAGVTGESTRDNPQRVLCGRISDGWGTGMLPYNVVNWKLDVSMARGVADLMDTVLVKHVSGGFSQLQFKSYEKGRQKWQGDTIDWIWNDEEPPEDVYSEGLTRVTATRGMVYITFTPLQGPTQVVNRFLSPKPEELEIAKRDRGHVNMTIDDAKHIPPEERESIVAGWPEHEREARKNGTPMLGSGKIFKCPESQIKCDPFPIPVYWRHMWGLDFGQDHPFAAVAMAWDVDTDTIYVYHTIRMSDKTIVQQAAAMKALKGGDMIPAAWPQDGHVRREFGGELTPVAQIFRAKPNGIKMLAEHAKHPDGSNSTEAGLLLMDERMKSNRFKVFSNLDEWWAEYRVYHRKEGQIVRLNDDLMSATRVGVMQIRSAKAVLYDPMRGLGPRRQGELAEGVDFDLFTGR